jgi:predicted RNA-binding Zn ribbon-like protein
MVVTKQAAEPGAAPGSLEIVRRFVNTLDIDSGTDELDSPGALLGWLRGSGLAGPGDCPATVADLRRAVALREALRGVLGSHVAAADGPGSPPGTAAAVLRKASAGLPVRLEVRDDGQVAPVPAGSGVAAGLAAVLLIAAEAASAGTWPRLKACSASDCRWAFYDRSPARTGCWCSMRVCGSRAKSRAYRRRAAGQPGRSRRAGGLLPVSTSWLWTEHQPASGRARNPAARRRAGA